MGVVVLVFLDQKRESLAFQVDGNFYVHRPFWRFSFIVVLLLDVPTGKGANAVADAALQVHQRDPLARAIVDEHGGNARS